MPFVGEIRMFAGNFAPAGWMFCEGQNLPISENDTLFLLIGTTFGGDGQETFALPDLRGRLNVHQNNEYILGQASGVETVTLTTQQIPSHSHAFLVSTASATESAPAGAVLGNSVSVDLYREDVPGTNLAAPAALAVGGNQPHENRQPYLCVDFIISLFGIFPSQT